jgi:predicted RNA-binding protein with PIN domain
LILIIDGYNVLKSSASSFNGSGGKKALLKQLVSYLSSSEVQVDRIIVVFDGGALRYPERDCRGNVETVKAGYMQSADDWIVNFVEKTTGTIIVVSNDVALGNRVFEHAGDVMTTEALQALLAGGQSAPVKKGGLGEMIEYSHGDLCDDQEIDRDELRSLMDSGTQAVEQASGHKNDEAATVRGPRAKKGDKGSRKLADIIKKL